MPPTDYRLAKTLGVSPARLSNWRREKNKPDALACMKLAKVLGMEFADVLAYVEEDRARNIEAKQQWAAILPRLLPSIAIGSFLLAGAQDLIGGKIYTPGKATITAASKVSVDRTIHYAQFARLRSRLEMGLRSLLTSTKRLLRAASPASAAA
jgi:DNA-binding XRE family transcriptional regulator